MGSFTLHARAFDKVPGATFPESKGAGSSISVMSLAFDAAADEAAQAVIPSFPADYTSGNLTVRVIWFADTATSGDVVFGASLSVITPNTDSTDVETDAWATENTVTDSHLGTTAQRLHWADITVSNLDSLAAGDHVAIRIRRLGSSSGSDTMSGDAQVIGLLISYS